MSDDQEYDDWKENVDNTLCILQEKLFYLEKKIKELEKVMRETILDTH